MAYFECIVGNGGGSSGIPLIVTCDSQFAGLTITATKSGAATQTATCPSSSPYTIEFELPEDGTWTISGTYSGQTFSEVVTITPYTATLNAIPEGSTATPTDDVQIWLHCGNIWDKNYTTISQVLADSTTLLALISDNNAVDYMVRSTTWATNVCANNTAMTYIGANDYCADTLLADDTWLNAICNSTYFESVLNIKVPTMTSDTSPSGVCFGSTKYNAQTDYYFAFDGNDSSGFISNDDDGTGYCGYKFTSPVKVYMAAFSNFPYDVSSYIRIKNFKIQGSNTSESSGYTDLYSGTYPSTNPTYLQKCPVSASNDYTYYRVLSTSGDVGLKFGIKNVQFYGRS